LIIIFSLVYSVDSVSKILILLLAFTNILSVPQILQYDFLARADSKYPSLITMFVTLVTSLLKVVMIFNGFGLIYIVAVMIFEQIMYGVLHIIAYRIKAQGDFTSWKFSQKIANLMIKTGSAIAFLSLFSILYSRIDQVMIRHFLDAQQLGLYSAGVRLVDLWGFIPTIILGGLYPAVLNARKVSEAKYFSRLRKTLTLLLFTSIGASSILFLFASFLLTTIFGNDFAGGAQALQIYGLSLPATFLSYFVMQILYTDDYRKMLIVITAIPAGINILLNLLLIPKYGIVGAAWATLIAYSCVIVLPFIFKQTRTKFMHIFTKNELV
jgi:O-antigen/teichoic acid export membrane protein